MTLISISGSAKITLPSPQSQGSSPLFELLNKNGYDLTADNHGNYLIAINHNEKKYAAFIEGGGKPEKAILLRSEPPSVFPAQYKKLLISKYGLVISPGMKKSPKSLSSFIGWPYEYNMNPNFPTSNDPKLETITASPNWQELFQIDTWAKRTLKLSMIAGNKIGPVRDGNYSVRRNLAFEIPGDLLTVYGPLWNDSLGKKLHHRAAVSYHALRHGILPDPISVY